MSSAPIPLQDNGLPGENSPESSAPPCPFPRCDCEEWEDCPRWRHRYGSLRATAPEDDADQALVPTTTCTLCPNRPGLVLRGRFWRCIVCGVSYGEDAHG
jgi:hypothetical protein